MRGTTERGRDREGEGERGSSLTTFCSSLLVVQLHSLDSTKFKYTFFAVFCVVNYGMPDTHVIQIEIEIIMRSYVIISRY